MKKAKPFAKGEVPDLTGWKPDDPLPRANLVALIADGKGKTHKQISSKLTGDTKLGKIQQIRPGSYTLDEIAKWIEKEYPGDFPSVPRHPRQGVGRAAGTSTVSGVGYALPATLEEREREIHRLLDRVRVLEGELATERRRADMYRHKAEKWDSSIKNKKKGKGGGPATIPGAKVHRI